LIKEKLEKKRTVTSIGVIVHYFGMDYRKQLGLNILFKIGEILVKVLLHYLMGRS